MKGEIKMAIMIYCSVCERKTLHSSSTSCLECISRQKKKDEEEWMKKSDEEKFRDLYSQIEEIKKKIGGGMFS